MLDSGKRCNSVDGSNEEHPIAVQLKLREPTAIFLAARRTALRAFSRRALYTVINRFRDRQTDRG